VDVPIVIMANVILLNVVARLNLVGGSAKRKVCFYFSTNFHDQNSPNYQSEIHGLKIDSCKLGDFGKLFKTK
jgi:hypothetical protein